MQIYMYFVKIVFILFLINIIYIFSLFYKKKLATSNSNHSTRPLSHFCKVAKNRRNCCSRQDCKEEYGRREKREEKGERVEDNDLQFYNVRLLGIRRRNRSLVASLPTN